MNDVKPTIFSDFLRFVSTVHKSGIYPQYACTDFLAVLCSINKYI